jgi:Mg-chelatase subunit ChlD
MPFIRKLSIRHRTLIFALIGTFYALASVLCADVAAGKNAVELRALIPTLDTLPPPKKLEASVVTTVTVNVPTNIFGFVQRRDKSGSVSIAYVAPGSTAYRRGLLVGDKIRGEQATNGQATIVVERGKKLYACTFLLRDKREEQQKEDQRKKVAQAEVGHLALSRNQIILLIDCSASMRTLDCPGGISRWQWCRKNTKSLYENCLRDYAKDVQIITFDTRLKVYRSNVNSKLDDIFNNDLPDGETFMAPPLKESFGLAKDSLDRLKPVMISVITDGRPSDFDAVKAAIIEQTNAMKQPDLLSISFIEVGSSERYLRELDNNLVSQGAHADVVSVTPFDTVNSIGLNGVLTDIALNAQKARFEKIAESQKPAKTNTPTSNQSSAANTVSQVQPVKVIHAVNRIPPVKAHPSGTPADGQIPKKVLEVDEKEAVRRENANKSYSF